MDVRSHSERRKEPHKDRGGGRLPDEEGKADIGGALEEARCAGDGVAGPLGSQEPLSDDVSCEEACCLAPNLRRRPQWGRPHLRRRRRRLHPHTQVHRTRHPPRGGCSDGVAADSDH